jgi:hypothetical protein
MKRWKPTLELPSKYLSEDAFCSEVGSLHSMRNFFRMSDGKVVHLVEGPGQETQLIEVTPEYLADYINREFQCVKQIEGDAIDN